MEVSMDMNTSPSSPRTIFLVVNSKLTKIITLMENDGNEHQLSLQTVHLGAGAKDELYIVEVEAINYVGSPMKVTLATLKMSLQPTVALGGFEIKRPVVLQLKCGLRPEHLSGQNFVAVEEDTGLEDKEEEDVKPLTMSGEHSVPESCSGKVPQEKVKLAADEDDEDSEDEEAEEKAPVIYMRYSREKCAKITPEWKRLKTINTKIKNPSKHRKNPPKTKRSSSVEDIKAKMQASIEKGGSPPKVEAKFISYMKNCIRVIDQEAIQDLWQWRKSL